MVKKEKKYRIISVKLYYNIYLLVLEYEIKMNVWLINDELTNW